MEKKMENEMETVVILGVCLPAGSDCLLFISGAKRTLSRGFSWKSAEMIKPARTKPMRPKTWKNDNETHHITNHSKPSLNLGASCLG